MQAQPWEPPLARLVGAFEESGKRLDGVERRVESLEQRMNLRFDGVDRRFDGVERRFDRLESKIDGNFRSVIGWMLGQTGIILAALAAVAYALRH